jgi:chromosome segregation ATPase
MDTTTTTTTTLTTTPGSMSFAQALNEAKAVIVQQSNRIKTDADKIRQQQQTIVDQCSLITEHEMKAKEQSAELAAKAQQIEQLEAKVAQLTVAREQAEAVIDRQGQRLAGLADQVAMLEQRVTEQSDQIDRLTEERDSYRSAAPSQDDEAALAAMAALLSTKKNASPVQQAGAREVRPSSMRIGPRAEAA